jgi:hypothetical protein
MTVWWTSLREHFRLRALTHFQICNSVFVVYEGWQMSLVSNVCQLPSLRISPFSISQHFCRQCAVWLRRAGVSEGCQTTSFRIRRHTSQRRPTVFQAVRKYRYHYCGGRSSSVGIVTRHGMDSPRYETRCRRDFPYTFRTGSRSTKPPVKWVLVPLPGDKAAGGWFWSPISNPEVKKKVYLYLYSQSALMARHRVNFYLYSQSALMERHRVNFYPYAQSA